MSGRTRTTITASWLAALLASAGILLLAFAASGDGQAQGSNLQPRAYAPALARDEGAPAATATPTRTATTAPTRTATSPAPSGTTRCTVSNVVDGDTIDVTGCADAGRIRLILVDTPEVYGGVQCYGREASDYTKRRLLGKTVNLERDVSNTDRYGRFLRYVWLDSELFNESLVRDGYATLATFPPDVKYVDRIRAAQTDARNANRGLWGACQGGVTPTATATSRPATSTPTQPGVPTAFPTATPPRTPTPGPSYYLPACYTPGQDRCNCGDFTTQGHAQWFHDNYDRNDVNRLDSDKDGVVCEGLPK